MKKWIVLTCLFLASCSTEPLKKESIPANRNQINGINQAKVLISKQQFQQAQSLLRRVINDDPNSAAAHESYVLIGDLYWRSGQVKESLDSYMNVVKSKFDSNFVSEARIKAARSLVKLQRHSEALPILDPALSDKNLSAALANLGLETRMEILKTIQAPIEELKTLLHLYKNQQNPSVRDSYRIQGIAIVESKLNVNDLEKISEDAAYLFAQAPAAFRLALARYEHGEYSKARSAFNAAITLAPDTEYSERSKEYLLLLDARERVEPDTIGVILPLSGKLASVGQKILQGIELGLGIYGKNRSSFKLAIIDDEGLAATARRGVERLVLEDHVVAIIGSISNKTAAAVASKAQEFGVPVLSLSQKPDITQVGEYVFRNALTSQMQVKQIVTAAIQQRGLKRFAVLYPNDPYGQEFATLFWDEVLKQGGEIRGAQAYPSNSTDFRVPVQKLIGTYYKEDRAQEYSFYLDRWKKEHLNNKRESPQDLLPPIVDFEALFIPDSAKTLGQVAPMLVYNEVKDTVLLGTNLWNTSSLISRTGKVVKEAIFVDSFLPTDPAFQNSEFSQKFKATFTTPPEEFEVLGFDAALLMKEALDTGINNRVDMQEALADLRGIEGAVGKLSVSEDREVIRPIMTLTTSGDQIIRK